MTSAWEHSRLGKTTGPRPTTWLAARASAAGRDWNGASDSALADGSAGGDETAFAEVYSRYFDRLYDFCLRTVVDRDAAADAVQETFVRAWAQLRKGRKPEHLKPWLFAIARNASVDELRRRKRLTPLEGGGAEEPFVLVDTERRVNPDAARVDQETRELVWASAQGLGAKDYALLDMHVRQELSVEEIAAALQAKVGAVYTMLSRLRDAVESSVAAELLRRRSDCAELGRLVAGSERLDRRLRLAIQAHVRDCDVCEERKRTLVAPATILAGFAPIAPPPQLRGALWANFQGGAHPTGHWTPQPGNLRNGFLGGAAVVAAGIALALFLAINSNESHDTFGQPISTGYLFIDGQYVAPPYVFEVTPRRVALNGVELLAAQETAKPATSKGDPKNALEVVERGTERMIAMGLKSTNVGASARAELKSLMEGFAVTAAVEAQDGQMLVRDRSGQEAYLVLETETIAERDEGAGFLAMAREWQAVLAGGGVLLLSPGVSVDLPSSEALPFMSLLHRNALAGGGADPLRQVLGDRTIANDLASAGDLPSSLRQRLPAELPPPLAGSVEVRRPWSGHRGLAVGAPVDEFDHETSQTPSSKKAYLFLALELTPKQQEKAEAKGQGGHPPAAVLQATRLHGYERFVYVNIKTKVPRIHEPTLLAFVDALKGGAGVLYVDSHGMKHKDGALQVESFTNTNDLLTKVNADREKYPELKDLNVFAGEAVQFAGETTYGLYLVGDGDKSTPNRGTGIKQLWKDADSIVQLDACFGMRLQPAFGTAREFIAPQADLTTDPATGTAFNTEFWGSMDGTLHDGHDRNVDKAYRNAKGPGFGNSLYVWVSRVDGATVLSPGVVTRAPEGPLTVGVEADGKFVFDVEMDTGVLPEIKLEYECDAQLVPGSEKWENSRTLVFKLMPRAEALLKITLEPENTRSKSTIELDGNLIAVGLSPGGWKSHVGPNGDGYQWIVACYKPRSETTKTPPPSPGTAEETPPGIAKTPTPTSTPTATATPTRPPSPSPAPSPSPTQTSGPLVTGPYSGAVTVLLDPGGHSCCVKPASTWNVLQVRNTQTNVITISLSDIVPGIVVSSVIPGTGASFTATSKGTVAGYPDVSVSFSGTVTPEGGVKGVLTVGGNGALPGGQPITFNVNLQKQ